MFGLLLLMQGEVRRCDEMRSKCWLSHGTRKCLMREYQDRTTLGSKARDVHVVERAYKKMQVMSGRYSSTHKDSCPEHGRVTLNVLS
ncbi:hypothetical protein MPTK1_4g11720 [Marchantia polymorpha subsp. ruderalis]|uniref:Uncharacterized protein n=2 Tax=Marchantia polymorpha TaxID=3197 RepID=A0AAF6B8X6_MARPO|nr:hypothetical protein MARPO_0011s0157 [Marchantia polymorpha]BBN08460.1 hypothetical protein Mp_4g11720 [Marchantia polymorpha subsp. ruderalis]|eukprot:PTQ46496.1 hypothetical protein MARPO_0011s0157 [Marchantia polymorpha]